jgi:hypothetical protein
MAKKAKAMSEILKRNDAEKVKSDDKNTFLDGHKGEVVVGKDILTALRSVKLVDGKPRLKMKVFELYIGKQKIEGLQLPAMATLKVADNNPSRSLANLVFGFSAEQLEKISNLPSATNG